MNAKWTFNLPDLQDRIPQGSGTRGSVGTSLPESLPNITGSFRALYQGLASDSGAYGNSIYSLNSAVGISAGNQGGIDNCYQFDASRSSPVYKDNAPIQQEAVCVNYIIKY